MQTRITLVLALVTTILGTVRAHAQEPESQGFEYVDEGGSYPQNYVLRPLTLTRGTVQGDLSLSIARIDFDFGSETIVGLSLGGGVGITDDLQVTLSSERIGGFRGPGLLNFRLTPDGDILDSALHARYRVFSSESFEIGAELGFVIPFETDFAFSVGAPFRVRVGDVFALDGAVEFVVFTGDDTDVGLSIPIQPRVAFGGFGYGGVNSGVRVILGDGNFLLMPLGFEAGATLDIGGTGLDAFVAFDFPAFLASEEVFGEREREVITEIWTLTIGARAYIDVFGG